MQYTTVLFDLDGTLTKSEEGITRTAIYAAEKMGFTGFTQEQFKVFIGPPLYDSFRKVVGMTEEQANQAIDHYHERYERVGWAENEVYAGIPVAASEPEKERRARGDCHREAAGFRRAHRSKIRPCAVSGRCDRAGDEQQGFQQGGACPPGRGGHSAAAS